MGDWNGDKIYRHGLLQLFATSLRHGAQKKNLQPRNKQTKCKEYNSDDISLKYLPCIYSGIYRIPESRLVEASILSQLLVRIDYKFRGSAGQKDNNKSKETIIVNKKCGIFVQRHAYDMRTIEQKGLDKDWFTMPSYRGYVYKYIQVIPKTALKTKWN